jgi:hypothetical protein
VAGGLGFLGRLPRVSAQEAALSPALVKFDADIEPLVRLIEESPRQRLLEEIADRIHRGRSYREVLAALLLAGVRNVQPRPSVGFKFHSVLVVNSCHLASLAGPDEDRWLPIFWALDYFKSAQADEARNSGWRMQPVNEALVPDAPRASALFNEAMDAWDVEKADATAAGLVRTAGATHVFNQFARYAARDFRDIGHKAIFLANSWRTLQVIGWQYAEPVLRSLAFAMLSSGNGPNPATSDLVPDRPWRENVGLLAKIPPNWLDGKLDDSVPAKLFSTFRNGGPTAPAETAADALAHGVGPQSIWDGVFVGAGELLMRQPGITALHGVTTANALQYLWQHIDDDRLRQRILLQACSFNALFRQSAQGRGQLPDRTVDVLQAAAGKDAAAPTVDEILADISTDRLRAAQKVSAYLAAGGSAREFADASRRLIFLKGRDSHDYKFSSAVLEDFGHVSPAWRDRFLALSVFNLKGSGDRNSPLVDRTRAALAG